jgi:hypothetical protein
VILSPTVVGVNGSIDVPPKKSGAGQQSFRGEAYEGGLGGKQDPNSNKGGGVSFG